MEVLVINPGSTSTKIAIYQDENPIYTESISHTPPIWHPSPVCWTSWSTVWV